MPSEMSPTCHSLDVNGPFHRFTCLLRNIPTKFAFLSVLICFFAFSTLFPSFVFFSSTFLPFYVAIPVPIFFISYTSTNIVPSVSRGQVISVRFCTLEDQFRSQGSQYGPSGRQRGTVLRCQFSLNVCPVPVHRSFRCVRTTDTLVAKCVIRTRPNPEFLLSCH